MGVMLSAAGSLQWLSNAVGSVPTDTLLREADEWPPGSEGLLFQPYLAGERTPHADPDARGAFVGLTLRHDRGALVRAVLEGVAYGLRDSLELLRGLGVAAEVGRVSGGGARSGLWLQIVAAVLGLPLERTAAEEGAAYGAALLGGVAKGVFGTPTRRSPPACACATESSPTQTSVPCTRTAIDAFARSIRLSRRSGPDAVQLPVPVERTLDPHEPDDGGDDEVPNGTSHRPVHPFTGAGWPSLRVHPPDLRGNDEGADEAGQDPDDEAQDSTEPFAAVLLDLLLRLVCPVPAVETERDDEQQNAKPDAAEAALPAARWPQRPFTHPRFDQRLDHAGHAGVKAGASCHRYETTGRPLRHRLCTP